MEEVIAWQWLGTAQPGAPTLCNGNAKFGLAKRSKGTAGRGEAQQRQSRARCSKATATLSAALLGPARLRKGNAKVRLAKHSNAAKFGLDEIEEMW